MADDPRGSAATRPLGVNDLHEAARLRYTPHAPEVGHCWYWCRLHKRAEQWVDATSRECVRVGPFMSEREASRMTGNQSAGYGAWALGMEVE